MNADDLIRAMGAGVVLYNLATRLQGPNRPIHEIEIQEIEEPVSNFFKIDLNTFLLVVCIILLMMVLDSTNRPKSQITERPDLSA